jgi:hypothetical protein
MADAIAAGASATGAIHLQQPQATQWCWVTTQGFVNRCLQAFPFLCTLATNSRPPASMPPIHPNGHPNVHIDNLLPQRHLMHPVAFDLHVVFS